MLLAQVFIKGISVAWENNSKKIRLLTKRVEFGTLDSTHRLYNPLKDIFSSGSIDIRQLNKLDKQVSLKGEKILREDEVAEFRRLNKLIGKQAR